MLILRETTLVLDKSGGSVVPGCPACEDAIKWLGQAQHAQPEIRSLLLAPWQTRELEAAASQAALPFLVDAGGRIGASLGVKRAPTVIFFLDGLSVGRLEWPSTDKELHERLATLAAAPRPGPWRYFGERVSLGYFTALDGQQVALGELPKPLLISFFNPQCPPCWDALPTLVGLSEEFPAIGVVVVHALTEDSRDRLRDTGLVVVLDDNGELAQGFGLRVTPTYVILDREGGDPLGARERSRTGGVSPCGPRRAGRRRKG